MMSSPDDAQTNKRPLQQPCVDPQSGEQFDGVRTKFGKRERKVKDKATKNARVRNSYLKLTLEDAVLDQLHRLVLQTRDQWDGENKASEDPPQDAVSKKQSRRTLSIKPRSRNSLHVTYFFAGKVLEEMSSEELQRWESMVRQCALEHNNRFDAGDYALRFKHLTTFPPRRPNLIAAVFESSPALESLYEELCALAMMEKEGNADAEEGGNPDDEASNEEENAIKYEFPLLRALTSKQIKMRKQHRSKPSWIAHVTLGNLAGGSKEDVRRLNDWLCDRTIGAVETPTDASNGSAGPSTASSMPDASSNTDASIAKTEASSALESDIRVLGLALGGPVPDHASEIDWNFPFHCDG